MAISSKVSKLLRKFRGEQYPGELLTRCEYATALAKAFHLVHHDHVEGDYLEFGVYKGWSLSRALNLAKMYRLHDMRLIGFDSFSGFPPSEDDTGVYFQEGMMKSARAEVEKLFGADELGRRAHLVEGFYDKTLTPELRERLGLRKAAIINVDCDIYESGAVVFPYIGSFLQPGTVLMIDDWYCYRGLPDRGIQRAFNEWIATTPGTRFVDYTRYGVHGKVMICTGVSSH